MPNWLQRRWVVVVEVAVAVAAAAAAVAAAAVLVAAVVEAEDYADEAESNVKINIKKHDLQAALRHLPH